MIEKRTQCFPSGSTTMISPSKSSKVSRLLSRLRCFVLIGYQKMITQFKLRPPNSWVHLVEIPNAETRKAMLEAIEGKELQEWSDLEALKGKFGGR